MYSSEIPTKLPGMLTHPLTLANPASGSTCLSNRLSLPSASPDFCRQLTALFCWLPCSVLSGTLPSLVLFQSGVGFTPKQTEGSSDWHPHKWMPPIVSQQHANPSRIILCPKIIELHLLNIYSYIFVSSSSYRDISTDLSDPLPPPFSIVHHFRLVFKATSCIITELLYVGSSWSSCLCLSLWRGQQEYVIYELIPTSPAVFCMSGLSNLNNFRDGWWVTVQLLICGVLSPGLVQYCSQHSCVVAIKLFLYTFSYHLCCAFIQQYRHHHCLEKNAFHFIGQVWLPYDQ